MVVSPEDSELDTAVTSLKNIDGLDSLLKRVAAYASLRAPSIRISSIVTFWAGLTPLKLSLLMYSGVPYCVMVPVVEKLSTVTPLILKNPLVPSKDANR